ncbi:hypothetical protein AMEX_G26777 [Astyanax mexicanus]|uniref:Uncharacterized protein n=1 Tax=Astyanax mexicanus TaxID=7994 RepID=A0A8T2KLB6_ASTMX|nr:hypothetical protein AMEX_G26777 [Astyanax mexicanus]
MVGKRKIKKANSAAHPAKKRSKGQLTVKPFQRNRRMSPEEEEDKEAEQSKGAYKVLGRLTVQKKHYWVKRDEVERRVKGENMSTNVFRSLLRVARKDLPKDVLNQPKSAKTRVSVFSALTEGEAQDLAEGFGAALMRHVPRYHLLDGIHEVDIAASHRTIQRIRTNFQSLGLESDFDLATHRFGPTAVEIFLSFLEETLQSTLGFMPYI